ncbi:MAG: hypothetical protein ACJ75B_14625 [Flavisolibacter sp.]
MNKINMGFIENKHLGWKQKDCVIIDFLMCIESPGENLQVQQELEEEEEKFFHNAMASFVNAWVLPSEKPQGIWISFTWWVVSREDAKGWKARRRWRLKKIFFQMFF